MKTLLHAFSTLRAAPHRGGTRTPSPTYRALLSGDGTRIVLRRYQRAFRGKNNIFCALQFCCAPRAAADCIIFIDTHEKKKKDIFMFASKGMVDLARVS